MRSCDDGYPGCRHAEATGKWCAGSCRTELQKELAALLEKREQVRAKQMERMHSGGMTRARTTTSNADADRLNERIVWLREQLKTPNVEVQGLDASAACRQSLSKRGLARRKETNETEVLC